MFVLWRTAAHAQTRIDAAQVALTQMRAAIASGDTATATRRLHDIQADTAAASRSTSGVAWSAASALPFAGRTPRAVRQLTRAADQLARLVLPDLVAAATVVDTGEVVAHGGRVDLTRVRRVGQLLGQANAAVDPIGHRLQNLPQAMVLPRVHSAGGRLRQQVRRIQTELADATAATDILPAMLGADGPRRYFVALQNNAEARGTGGLVGAYAIVVADAGRLRLVHTGPDDELKASLQLPLVPRFDADFTALYGDDPGLWQNSNMSPHFPYAAALWLQMWRRSTGQRLDGAIAIDPVAASYLLRATGPARLADGEVIDAGNVAEKTERGAYQRFASNDKRKTYLRAIAAALFRHLFAGAHIHSGLAAAIRRAVGEDRLLVYSAHSDEERVLSRSNVAGALPEHPGPFLEVAVDNAGPGKLDYYLQRTVNYALGPCADDWRTSEVTIDLHSKAPSTGLTHYVLGPTQRLLVYVYLSAGARPASVSVDGRSAGVFVGRERGHPVIELPVNLPPGQTRSISVGLVEPAGAGKAVVRTQPLVLPQVTRVRAGPC